VRCEFELPREVVIVGDLLGEAILNRIDRFRSEKAKRDASRTTEVEAELEPDHFGQANPIGGRRSNKKKDTSGKSQHSAATPGFRAKAKSYQGF
jgi:hypothetical protein